MISAGEVNYSEIMSLIQEQLLSVVNDSEHYETYKDYKFIMSLEQQFMKIKDKDPKAIYIVVKFGAVRWVYGQFALPATITILSDQNHIENMQQLFIDYVGKFSLARVSNGTIQQVYESPVFSTDFNAIYEGWRSLIRVSSSFVISKSSNFYSLYCYYTDENNNQRTEEIPFINNSLSVNSHPDPQVFYNSNDFTRSIITMGSVGVTFSAFLMNSSYMMNKIIDMLCGTNSSLTYGTDGKPILNPNGSYVTVKKSGDTGFSEANVPNVNFTFNIGIRFRDGRERTKLYHLVNFSVAEELGQIPVAQITLAE